MRLEKNDYIKALQSKQVKKLYGYVEEILREYDYDGSPTKNGYIDRETLNQIIDRVLLKAQELEEIDEIIINENFKGMFNPRMLLRGLVELIIINELFIVDEDEIQEDTRIFEDVETTFFIKIFEDDIRNLIEKKEIKYFGSFL